ncbi:MAG: methyltransferase domain-containing protein [Candidatus Eisenbacteria bacterium]
MSWARSTAKILSDYSRGRSLGYRLRQRRIGPLVSMIESVHRVRGSVRILDVGGTPVYWRLLPKDFLERHNVHVTLLNLDLASGPPPARFAVQVGDACALPYESDSFDICHSNSVLETLRRWVGTHAAILPRR